MNKGVNNATGQYIIFMNAGDRFFDENVLTTIAAECLKGDYPDIIYGRTVFEKYGLYHEEMNGSFHEIPTGMVFAHQSTFSKRELLIRYPFNETYKIAADYDFLSTMYDIKCKNMKTDSYISVFDNLGVSSIDIDSTQKEALCIRKKHGYITDSDYHNCLSTMERELRERKTNENQEPNLIYRIYEVLIPNKIRKFRGIRCERKRLIMQGWVKDLGSFQS